MFGEEREADAAGLLEAYLPEAISRELRWSSLKWQPASFIDDRLRGSEPDLLYADRARGRRRTSVAVTTRLRKRWDRLAEAIRRQVPGGGELVNKADEMVEIYGEMREREGRQEGRREGQLATIENLVRTGWRLFPIGSRVGGAASASSLGTAVIDRL